MPTTAEAEPVAAVQVAAAQPAAKIITDATSIFLQPGRTTRPKRLAIVLRGLPGSGKSHIAKKLKDIETQQGGDAPRIHAIDDYFYTVCWSQDLYLATLSPLRGLRMHTWPNLEAWSDGNRSHGQLAAQHASASQASRVLTFRLLCPEHKIFRHDFKQEQHNGAVPLAEILTKCHIAVVSALYLFSHNFGMLTCRALVHNCA